MSRMPAFAVDKVLEATGQAQSQALISRHWKHFDAPEIDRSTDDAKTLNHDASRALIFLFADRQVYKSWG